ncbi:MAG: hypothetical protein ACE37B_04960 [Ilumatobacter sp.]|uniref:hypothetical protein n=1 Tax=Ilumatobacter sp. TaxID=1967498 RepID=UPI00391A92C4
MHDLIVRFAVPDGQHLHDDPVPGGMIATSVEMEPDVALVVEPAVPHPTKPHTLAGTGETLQIFEGDVQIRVLLTPVAGPAGRAVRAARGGHRAMAVVRRRRVPSPAARVLHHRHPAARYDNLGLEVANQAGMDVTAHLTRMVSRRTDP